ncbi:MAG: flippase-like domain-containing protein [Candidatus Thermoplasmatota archaeon]|nr:flippase-like domain-containing protein [Candidatus Thermoplasmatota archaeon]
MKITTLFPILGLALFFYILFSIGPEKIIATFLTIKLSLFIIALLFFIPRMFLYAYKWYYLCKLQLMTIGFKDDIIIFLISLFYGSVTPGGIGYYIRIYYIKAKCYANLEKCITNSLIDSASGFIAGLLLSLVGSLIIIQTYPGLFPTFLFATIIYLSVFLFFMKKERGNKLVQNLIKPFTPKRFKERIDQSLDFLYEDMPPIRTIPWVILLECILWILGAIPVWIIAQSFTIAIPILYFIFMSIIAEMAGALPISIGGLGVREGMLVFLFSSYGVTAEIAFVIALSGFLVKKLFPGLFGLPLSLKYHTFNASLD